MTFPYTSGIDVSGTVVSVGPGAKKFRLGQPVYGISSGSYAEYAIASEIVLSLKPDNISFDQAAATPIGGRTAWIALFVLGDLQEGQTLLVHGAAGGVGNFVVQLGRWKGAHVIGTASSGNIDFIKSLGVETAIDYSETRFEDVVSDVDIVVDSVGGDVEDRSWQVIKPGGILITMVHPVSPENTDHDGIRTASTNMAPQLMSSLTIDPLQSLQELIAAGDIVPQVGQVFALENAKEAQELCETGHGRGRIILHVRD